MCFDGVYEWWDASCTATCNLQRYLFRVAYFIIGITNMHIVQLRIEVRLRHRRNADGTTAGTPHRGCRSRRRQCSGSASVGAAARVGHGEGAVLQDASSVQRQLRRVSSTREDQLPVLRTPSWRHRAESGSRAGPASGGGSDRGPRLLRRLHSTPITPT